MALRAHLFAEWQQDFCADSAARAPVCRVTDRVRTVSTLAQGMEGEHAEATRPHPSLAGDHARGETCVVHERGRRARGPSDPSSDSPDSHCVDGATRAPVHHKANRIFV